MTAHSAVRRARPDDVPTVHRLTGDALDDLPRG